MNKINNAISNGRKPAALESQAGEPGGRKPAALESQAGEPGGRKPAALESLARLSNRYGADTAYVLAGGGNSSWKDAGELYIKSSGTSLATIKAEEFVGLDRNLLDAIMVKEYVRDDDAGREAAVLADMMDARLPGFDSRRPSVETLLHNLFPYEYVLHLHPALVNGVTCGLRGEKTARELFGKSCVWVPEYRPGYELAKLCGRLIDGHVKSSGETPKILFLENHGVFAAAGSVGEIDEIYSRIMGLLNERAKTKPAENTVVFGIPSLDEPAAATADESAAAAADEPAAATADVGCAEYAEAKKSFASVAPIAERFAELPVPPRCASYIYSRDIAEACENRENFRALSGAFTPDHIVYCKAKFLFLDEINIDSCAEKLSELCAAFVDAHGYEPRVICVRGAGAFICAETERVAENARALFIDAVNVSVYSRNFGGPRHMSDELVKFIVNWEIESYRQKVAR